MWSAFMEHSTHYSQKFPHVIYHCAMQPTPHNNNYRSSVSYIDPQATGVSRRAENFYEVTTAPSTVQE